MQEKVIKSLSNIESLMVNKLSNTNQKLKVLSNADKADVIEFLKRKDGGNSRSRKRGSSRLKNKLRNVHSIQADASNFRRPQMEFVERANSIDAWAKKPNASFMAASIDSSG